MRRVSVNDSKRRRWPNQTPKKVLFGQFKGFFYQICNLGKAENKLVITDAPPPKKKIFVPKEEPTKTGASN